MDKKQTTCILNNSINNNKGSNQNEITNEINSYLANLKDLHKKEFIKNTRHFVIESQDLPKQLTISSLENNNSAHKL